VKSFCLENGKYTDREINRMKIDDVKRLIYGAEVQKKAAVKELARISQESRQIKNRMMDFRNEAQKHSEAGNSVVANSFIIAHNAEVELLARMPEEDEKAKRALENASGILNVLYARQEKLQNGLLSKLKNSFGGKAADVTK